jgi:hypothetical protein
MKSLATFFAALLLALFARTTNAGPPLVCHTFDIANAKSLPWISHSWNLTGSESYNTKNLAADTLSLLDADPIVLVHMETLRRAALYGAKDAVALKHLVLKLIARSDNAPTSALALFDLGYLSEILTQLHWIAKDFSNPAQNLDGYALVLKALQLRPNDPQMEFAAALITLEGPTSIYQAHAQIALAGAKSDRLLARNLSAHFMSQQSETMADMLSHNSNSKVARQ